MEEIEIEEPPLYLIDLCNLFNLRPAPQYATLLLLLVKLKDGSGNLERERVLNFLKMGGLSLNYQQTFESLAQLEKKGILKNEGDGLFSINKLIPTYESMKLIDQGALSFNLNISYRFKKRNVNFELIEQEESGKKKKKEKPSKERPLEEQTIQKVVDYLNLQTGKNFKSRTTATRSSILGRLREGYTFSDFKCVIDGKVLEWAHDPSMAKYLRPATLFTPSKFEAYLNEFEQIDSVEVNQKEQIKENFREALRQKLGREKQSEIE